MRRFAEGSSAGSPLAQFGPQAKSESIFSPGNTQQLRHLDQQMQQRSEQCTERQSINAKRFAQEQHTAHDSQLVHCRSQSRDQEMVVGVQDSHQEAAQTKNHH